QEESRTFVSCRTTVDIERPREGGAAINCSQIASRHFSASAAAVGLAGASAADFADLLADGDGAGACAAGASGVAFASAFFGMGGVTCTAAAGGGACTTGAFFDSGAGASGRRGCAGIIAENVSGRDWPSASSRSARSARSCSNAWLTELSVSYLCDGWRHV